MSISREHVIWSYRLLLGREPESEEAIADKLRAETVTDLRRMFIESAEFAALSSSSIKQKLERRELPNLQLLNPSKYEWVRFFGSSDTALTFRARNPSDYDWLERMILEHSYYDMPGVWSPVIDPDKEVIAEIVTQMAPNRVLELGCSTGAVIKLLNETGIDAEGIEISHMALALAYPTIKRKIHFGDVLTLDLKPDYDVIVAMDIFEHFNPNKIDTYIARCYDLLADNGVVFSNIPAFGTDAVFGQVFPIYLEPWQSDAATDGLFSSLHVDDRGWPRNGHLIWATASWWKDRFESAGFVRQQEIETRLHKQYDPFYVSSAPARKSFFVFAKRDGRPTDCD